MSGVELKLTAYRERRPPGLELIPLSSTKSSLALADAAAAARHLLFEGVLDLFAGVFEVGLRLVALALIFGAPVAGDLADRFLSLAAQILGLILRLIRTAHSVSSYFAGIDPGGRNLSPLGTSPAGFQNVRVPTGGVPARHRQSRRTAAQGRLQPTPTRNITSGCRSSLIASVVCATLRLSTPSCGYSPAVRPSIREQGGEPGSRQVDELLGHASKERRPDRHAILFGWRADPFLVPRAQSRRGNRSASRRLSLTLLAALTVTRVRFESRVSRLLGDFIENTSGA